MDPSLFGSLGGGSTGGLLSLLQKQFSPTAPAAPAVPADGAMQPTIGPGAAPPAASQPYATKFGMPRGGILGLLQGGSPQGLMGLLQHMRGPGGTSLAGGTPPAGMLSGLPGTNGSPFAGPVAPPPQLPTDINPMNQF